MPGTSAHVLDSGQFARLAGAAAVVREVADAVRGNRATRKSEMSPPSRCGILPNRAEVSELKRNMIRVRGSESGQA